MTPSMMKQDTVKIGNEVEITAPIDNLTFTDVKYSSLKIEGDKLSISVEGLIMFKPYPQISADKDGSSIKKGTFVFSGVVSSDRVMAALKDDWMSRAGADRFEPEIQKADCNNQPSSTAKVFDIGAGYFIVDGKEFEVRKWEVTASSLVFIPEEI